MFHPMHSKHTLTEEKNIELEKARRRLKKLKNIEKETPMFCTTVDKTKVCASSEKRLEEIINELKNR